MADVASTSPTTDSPTEDPVEEHTEVSPSEGSAVAEEVAHEVSEETASAPSAPPDPLLTPFDAVVMGTGCVESIIASALTRHGKRVLHLDVNQHYGGADSSLTLTQFIDWHASLSSTSTSDSSKPTTFTGPDPIGSPSPVTVRPTFSFSSSSSSSSSSPAAPPPPSTTTPPPDNLTAVARRFSLDLRPRLVLARGDFVDLLVRSDVSNYIEFRTLEASYVLFDDPSKEVPTPAPFDPRISKVPSGKGDVFQHKHLGLMEKRRLMKFLQFTVDHMTQAQGAKVENRNETLLAHGRTLTRPQNKKVETHAFPYEEYKDRPFNQFLEACHLSAKLQSVVLHAVAMVPGVDASGAPILGVADHETTASAATPSTKVTSGSDSGSGSGSGAGAGADGADDLKTPLKPSPSSGGAFTLSTEQGMKLLHCHLGAMGRFGGSPYLVGLYGAGDIPQAFCRAAAVGGATYMLDTEPTALRLDEDSNVVQVELSCGARVSTKWVVSAPEYAPESVSAFPTVARAVCIVDGLITETGRSLLIIPPQARPMNNTNAIFVTQVDHTSGSTPAGFFLVYLCTMIAPGSDGAAELAALEATISSLTTPFKAPSAEETVEEEVEAAVGEGGDVSKAGAEGEGEGEDVSTDAATEKEGKAEDAEAPSATTEDVPTAPQLVWSASYIENRAIGSSAIPNLLLTSDPTTALRVTDDSAATVPQVCLDYRGFTAAASATVLKVDGSVSEFYPAPERSAFRDAREQEELDELTH